MRISETEKYFQMKPKLLVDEKHIISELGAPYERELTFPQIFKDSRYSVFPVIIEIDGKKHVIVGAADAAAHAAASQPLSYSTNGRYFDWNQGPGFKSASFAEAVRAVTGPGEISVEALLPVGRYQALEATGPVSLFGVQPDQPVYLYSRERAGLEAIWQQTRDADVPRLTPFVSGLRFGEKLIEAMSAAPLGFEILDRLAETAGLSGILISDPFNLEMFSGLPGAEIADFGMVGFYRPNDASITLISTKPVFSKDFLATGNAPSLSKAVAGLASGRTGFLRDHLDIGTYGKLSAEAVELVDATYVIRRFFDERAGTDLLYFITAANAVLAGVEHAKAFIARTAGSPGLTERDVAAVYHQGVEDFAHKVGMSGRVFPYFDIIHPGSRTLLPAMAGDYPISATDETIKFDMGLLVTDSTGVVRGCSDIARSISPDPALQTAHDKLRNLLIDELIPAIKSGMTGSEIHAIGVDVLRPMTDELKACGLLHADMDIDGYTRDCGHTLQRQTLATVHFLPGFKETLHTGMLGCTEFVWPIDDKIIACEDGYYVTASGAIPFTV